MTEYKCKRGFKIDAPEYSHEEEIRIYVEEPEIRAFCAFCGCGELGLSEDDDSYVVKAFCEFLRADLSWDEWGDDTFDDWEDDE